MTNLKITGKCPQCGGDGVRSLPDASVQPPVFNDIPCTTCNGTGIIDISEMDAATIDDILDKVENIKAKVKDIDDRTKDIWNKVKDM